MVLSYGIGDGQATSIGVASARATVQASPSPIVLSHCINPLVSHTMYTKISYDMSWGMDFNGYAADGTRPGACTDI